MKKAIALIILAVLLLSVSACEDEPVSASAPTEDVICYEDFPSVPDLGTLLGYEQYTKTHYEDLTLYSYQVSFLGSDGSQRFGKDVEKFARASEMLGNTPDTYVWTDDMIGRVSCGDNMVYIVYTTGEHNGEVLPLLIVAIGPPESFDAYASAA